MQLWNKKVWFAHRASLEKKERKKGETRGRRRKGEQLHRIHSALASEGHCCRRALCEKGTSFKTAVFLKHTHTHTEPSSVFLSQLPLDLKIAAALSPTRGSNCSEPINMLCQRHRYPPALYMSACTYAGTEANLTAGNKTDPSCHFCGFRKRTVLPKQRHR